MDIIGNWKVAYYVGSSGEWITPEDGEDLHLYSIIAAFDEDGSLLILMPMSMEFSKEELAAMDSELLGSFEEQGLYDPKHPDMLVTGRSRWKTEGGANYLCNDGGEDNIFSEGVAEQWTEISEDGDMIVLNNAFKLVRAESDI